jgi:hypothetical protein
VARVEVTFNGAALRSLAVQASADDLRVRANRVVSRARQLVPVDRGQLRGSIAVEFTQSSEGAVARIGSNLPYAIFVHEGTGVFGPRGTPITPKNGQYLVFKPRSPRPGTTSKSGFVFARSVQGMKGTPYLRDALDAAR